VSCHILNISIISPLGQSQIHFRVVLSLRSKINPGDACEVSPGLPLGAVMFNSRHNLRSGKVTGPNLLGYAQLYLPAQMI